jgi:hypothetical protein
MGNLTPRERMRALRLKESGEVSGDGSASVTSGRSADSDRAAALLRRRSHALGVAIARSEAGGETGGQSSPVDSPRKTENM